MVSAFNLFRMPVPWRGAFTYAKQVPASVCPGGDPNTMVHLAITTVPMGWVGAVDVIHHVARNIVFKLARVPSTTEVRPRGLFPDHGPYSLVCMDGIDIVSRVRQAGTRRDGTSATRRGENSLAERFQEVDQRWASRCTRGKGWSELRVAPFWEQKSTVSEGNVRHGRKKGHALVLRTLLLLETARWTATPLQHCVGLITFAAGFRRQLLALFESVYKDITDHDDFRPFSPSDTAVTELLLAALCVPLAAVDLRSPIRPVISTSDASHAGGGAAEARSFLPNLNPAVQALSEAQAEEANEEAAFVEKGLTCHPCCFSVAGNSATAPCPWRCGFGSCSPQCYVVHLDECRLRTLPVQTVALYLDSHSHGLWPNAGRPSYLILMVSSPSGVSGRTVCSETGPCTRWHGGWHGKSGRICACGLRMYSIWRSARVAVTLTSDDLGHS